MHEHLWNTRKCSGHWRSVVNEATNSLPLWSVHASRRESNSLRWCTLKKIERNFGRRVVGDQGRLSEEVTLEVRLECWKAMFQVQQVHRLWVCSRNMQRLVCWECAEPSGRSGLMMGRLNPSYLYSLRFAMATVWRMNHRRARLETSRPTQEVSVLFRQEMLVGWFGAIPRTKEEKIEI